MIEREADRIRGQRELSCAEELTWRNECENQRRVPFLECPRSMATVVRTTGPLNIRALADAVNGILRRHSVLRSAFRETNGHLERSIVPCVEQDLLEIDCLGSLDDSQDDHAVALVLPELNSPWNLADGPLLRTRILKLGRRRHLVAVIAHHIVFDGVSRRVLARELSSLYGQHAGIAAGGGEWPRDAASYSDYVVWQRDQLTGSTFANGRKYWMERLDGLSNAPLTGTGLRLASAADLASGVQSRHFVVSSESAEALRAFSRLHSVTMAMSVLALFTLLVHTVNGATDISIGVVVTDRPHRKFEHVIGLFMNVLAVRTEVIHSLTLAGFVRQVRENFATAYEHREIPYGRLVEMLKAEHGDAYLPCRAILNYNNVPAPTIALPGLVCEAVGVTGPLESIADVGLHVRDIGGPLKCSLAASDALFSEAELFDATNRFACLSSALVRAGSKTTVGDVLCEWTRYKAGLAFPGTST